MTLERDASPDLIVEIPEGHQPEREYACSVVLESLLGLACRIHVAPGRHTTLIRVPGDPRYVEVVDAFFPLYGKDDGQASELAPTPHANWALPVPGIAHDPSMPILFGRPDAGGSYLASTSEHVSLGIDVFGSAFSMLTRHEECRPTSLDQHGRFVLAGSRMDRTGLWQRPIVDEYAKLLLHSLRLLWPGLPAAPGRYRLLLSHDVDRLFTVVRRPWPVVARHCLGDVLQRRDPGAAARRAVARVAATLGSWKREPVNTFDYIMDVSERRSIVSAFYFIPKNTEPRWDADYELEDPWVVELLQSISRRGHEIGLHGSYRSVEDAAMLRDEFLRLRTVTEARGIRQDRWGGRQHYLRWRSLESWTAWDAAGLDYDSTLGFAERAGFRCGTSHEFPVFDLRGRRRLALRERPLIAMDVTLLSSKYMGLDEQGALATVAELAAQCRLHGGCLTLLWHNTSLITHESRNLYEALLDVAA
jgi:hypothetical protein